jgi:ABC-type spermidine/putrescine transport system permease subunit I
MSVRLNFWLIVSVLTWVLLAVLLFEPVGSVLITSLFDKEGHFTLANYGTFFSQWRFAQSFLNTLVVGFGALVGALLLGCTMAFCVSRFHIAGSRFLSLLSILALVSPPFIGAYSWIVLFGAGGVVRGFLRDIGINMPPIYGVGGILMVFSLKFYPYVYLMVSGALSNVNRSLEEAAEGLGLTPWQRTFKISFPMVFPALTAGGLLALIHAIADFGTPRLLLMDEPLSNLDAKLRIELREEIRDMQKQVDIATIYVTHDQEEALAISDRICVMNAGRIEQVGTPEEIYGNPQTRFVAEFVGTLNTFRPGEALDAMLGQLGLSVPDAASWSVRPERLGLAAAGAAADGMAVLPGTVTKYTYLGREAHVQVETPAGPMVVQLANPGMNAARQAGQSVSVLVPRDAPMAFGADGTRIGG